MSELKIQKIEDADSFTKIRFLTEYNLQGKNLFAKKNAHQETLDRLEKAFASDSEVHERNLSKLEMNRRVKEEITSFMNAIGMPSTYRWTDPKSRARFPKPVTKSAGYTEDIRRNIVTSDGFDEEKYRVLKTQIEREIHRLEQAIEEAAEERTREEENRKKQLAAQVVRAEIVLRRGLAPETDWEGVMDHLLNSNNLLNLAHAMEKTRGDWSEGYYRVENALFEPETEFEKLVIEDVSHYVNDEDGFIDGRVFRDCQYSYDVIFGWLNENEEQLRKDYDAAKEEVRGSDYW